jgi:hypothetical protein
MGCRKNSTTHLEDFELELNKIGSLSLSSRNQALLLPNDNKRRSLS